MRRTEGGRDGARPLERRDGARLVAAAEQADAAQVGGVAGEGVACFGPHERGDGHPFVLRRHPQEQRRQVALGEHPLGLVEGATGDGGLSGRAPRPPLAEQPFDLAGAERQVVGPREETPRDARLGQLGRGKRRPHVAAVAETDPHLRRDGEIEPQPVRRPGALQAVGDRPRGAPRNRRPQLFLGQDALEDRLQLGGVAKQEPGLSGPHHVAVGLEVGADRQHAVRGVLQEADVVAAAVERRGAQRRDADVDLVEKTLRPLEQSGGDERRARRGQRGQRRLQLGVAHHRDAHLGVAIEDAGQRGESQREIAPLGARTGPSDHQPLGGAGGAGGAGSSQS